MKYKKSMKYGVSSLEEEKQERSTPYTIHHTRDSARDSGARGMTLIETLVAITILSVAIIAPMTLTVRSLSAAFYARDQILASNLAQEAIESVRSVRDGNILTLALNFGAECSPGVPMHLLCGIPINIDFIIDARDNAMTPCSGACPQLQTDINQTLYGYASGWTDTSYRRTVHAEFVGGAENEVRITVTVTRDAGTHQLPPTVIYENLYRWVSDGTGV